MNWIETPVQVSYRKTCTCIGNEIDGLTLQTGTIFSTISSQKQPPRITAKGFPDIICDICKQPWKKTARRKIHKS